MNREKAQELITEAAVFLERDIDIIILDNENKFNRKASCKFKGWGSVTLSENDDQQNISLYAKLADNNNPDKTYSPSLKSVVAEFKRLDSIK